MKRSLLLLTICFMWLAAAAQVRNIPATVTDAFKQKFPSAASVSWKDKLTNFEASFKMGNRSYTASFNKDGALKRTEKIISYDELPADVKAGFSKSKYAGWKKGTIAEVSETDDGFRYRIFVEKNKVQKKFIYFNSEGQLVKEGNI
jgi:hypothetical protein